MPFPIYWSQISVEENRRVDIEIAERVARGRMVVDGRYIHIFQPETFKIFLSASISVRVLRVPIYKREGETDAEVEETLKQREANEVSMGKLLYGVDYDYRGRKHYNLVLDTDNITPEQEFSSVMEAMRKQE